MVKILPGNGVINLESTLEITEGQLAAIKVNNKKVDEICKDLHVSHMYYKTEDGNIISKIGCVISKESDALLAIDKMRDTHRAFIRQFDNWMNEDLKADEKRKDEDKPINNEDGNNDIHFIGFLIPVITI